MSTMKDSGVEWIGKVPENWDIRQLNYLFKERKSKNIEDKENNILSLSYGKIVRRNIADNIGLIPESFINYNIVNPGNIVLRLTDMQNDHRSLRTGLVKERGIITSAYLTLENKLEIDCRYFHYLLYSYDVMKIIYNMGNGVRQNINYSEISKLPLLVPTVNEQNKISNYLDNECTRIDYLIECQQKVIEKLKEYKQSVISEAVTKGLNPDVPMKDSGVEWIGKIPEHWKIGPIKYFASIKTGNTPKENIEDEIYSEYGIPWIKPEDLGGMDSIERTGKYISQKGMKFIRIIPANSIFVCCIGSIGKTGFSNIECCTNQQINALTFYPNMYWKFGYYSVLIQEKQHWFYANGNVLKILNSTEQGNVQLAIPAYSEQTAIADYLDKKCAKINQLIAQKEQIITKLTEYKKSLIYEMVTGKKEVPIC